MTTSIARRTRSTLALVAGAALLGLAACGTDGGDEATAPPAGGSEVSDGGEQEQPMDDQAPSDGGGATGDGEEEATQDEGGTAASGERTRIMLVTDLGIDDTSAMAR